MGRTFFGLTSEHKVEVHKLLFSMSYYSNGTFTFQDMYNMPIYLRTFYKKQLEDVKKKEAESMKASSRAKPPKR